MAEESIHSALAELAGYIPSSVGAFVVPVALVATYLHLSRRLAEPPHGQGDGRFRGEELSQDRQEDTPEDRSYGQAVSMRQMPKTKSEAGKKARPLVLPDLLEP